MAACYRLWGKRDKMPCFVTRLARIGWLRHDPARPLCRCIGFDYGGFGVSKAVRSVENRKRVVQRLRPEKREEQSAGK